MAPWRHRMPCIGGNTEFTFLLCCLLQLVTALLCCCLSSIDEFHCTAPGSKVAGLQQKHTLTLDKPLRPKALEGSCLSGHKSVRYRSAIEHSSSSQNCCVGAKQRSLPQERPTAFNILVIAPASLEADDAISRAEITHHLTTADIS